MEAIEEIYFDRLAEHIERLAHRAVRGELWDKAVECLYQAGKKATSRSATQEAIAYFEQALDVIKHLPDGKQTIEKAINIRADLGPTLIPEGRTTEVEQNYTRARAVREVRGDASNFSRIVGIGKDARCPRGAEGGAGTRRAASYSSTARPRSSAPP